MKLIETRFVILEKKEERPTDFDKTIHLLQSWIEHAKLIGQKNYLTLHHSWISDKRINRTLKENGYDVIYPLKNTLDITQAKIKWYNKHKINKKK